MSSTYETKINEHQLDLDELKNLLGQSNRKTVKDLLNQQVERTQEEITKFKKLEQDRLARLNGPAATGAYTKKIDTFGWDQSDKFVKIYLTSLNDANKLKDTDVKTTFTSRNADLFLNNLNNINYSFSINNLLHDIDSEGSYAKCKSDMVTLFLKKKEPNKSWNYISEKEMKAKEKSMPKFDEKADPQEGLMSMMKKMYEEGDDEMKRTITKAFAESRDKSLKGEPGMDEAGLGGLNI